MKQSGTTMKELMKRYRAVLLKCALMNAVPFFNVGQAAAEDLIMTGNDAIVNEDGALVYDNVSMADNASLTLTRDALYPATAVQTSSFTMTGGTSLVSTNSDVQTDTLTMSGNATATGDSLFRASAGKVTVVLTGHAKVSSTRAPFALGADITMSDYASIAVTSNFYTPLNSVSPSLTMSGNSSLTADGNFTMNNGSVTMSDRASVAVAGFKLAATTAVPSLTMSGESLLTADGVFRMEGANVTMSDSAAITADSLDNVSSTDLTVNGGNTLSASTTISFRTNSSLTVGNGATLTAFSQYNTIKFDKTSSLNLSETLNGNVDVNTLGDGDEGAVAFNSAAARLNGTLSGTVNLVFNDNYAFGNINAADMTLKTITIAPGKTLDIGENRITATLITGGTLKAALTDAAEEVPIIQAAADDVTLSLDMSKASHNEVKLYHITTDTEHFTFGEYNTGRYAVSDEEFTVAEAETIGVLSDAWRGGNLYILRLVTAGEAAIEDLIDQGVPVTATEEKAIAVLNDEVIEKLAPAAQAAAQRINTLLENAAGNTAQVKQILREITPEAAPAATQTASANAGAVINVVSGTRMGAGAPAPAAVRGGASSPAPAVGGGSSSTGNKKGRSGGDYTAGALSAWVQGLYNRGDLHMSDNGFDSESTGFAAGLEYAINDSVKAGVGYAFTTTDIDTARSTTDVDTHTGFVYGEYRPENLYVNGVLSYGHSKYDETTRITGLKSEYRANTFAGQIMTGYAFGDITPEIGLRYTSVRQRSYTDALGAKMASQTLDTWTWVGGVNASTSFREGDIAVTPNAKLALTYDFARDGQARTVTLANGSGYVAEGEAMKRFGVEIGAGVSATFGRTEVGLSYEGKFKDHYTDNTGMINVKYNF